MKAWLQRSLGLLQSFAERPSYPFVLAFFSLVDGLIFILPVDGILVTSVFAHRKRWLTLSIAVALGTVAGSLITVWIVHHWGLDLLHLFAPQLEGSKAWQRAVTLVEGYGGYAIVLSFFSLMVQHPVIILAALAKVSTPKIALLLIITRLIRYLGLGWISAHSPRLLRKFWGVRDEVKQLR